MDYHIDELMNDLINDALVDETTDLDDHVIELCDENIFLPV